jgi:hypothetical protein
VRDLAGAAQPLILTHALTADLARRLGVNEALLATMTGDLTRRGYLAALNTSCATACAGAE